MEYLLANPGLEAKWRNGAAQTAWCSIFVFWLTAAALSAQVLPGPATSDSQPSPLLPSSVTNAAPNRSPTNSSSTSPQDTTGTENYRNMSLEQLMNQDVTSVSKTPEPYGQAPAAIQIITNDEIRRSGATNLPEALQLADNLEVAQDNAHDWNISARGFNTGLSNKLLVLIDGRTVYTPLFSGVIWDVQNVMLEDLDRIEVISGPGGTLWGANAVNGVINIVSKSAQDTQGWYMEGGGGSELRDFGAIRYGGTLAPNVYYRVYGTYFNQNNENYTGGDPADDGWSQGKGGFRLDTAGDSPDKFTVQGDYYNGAADEPLPTAGRQVQSGGDLLSRWSHTFSNDSDMSLQMYYDRTNISEPEPAVLLSPAGILSDDLDTYDLDFQHRFSIGDRNRIIWGLGYRFTHDVVGNSPGVQILPATLDQNLYNAFVQDEIKLQDNLFFTLGTKLEHNDYTGFEFEPSGRLQWNFASKQMLWAAVSRAVRTPSRLDRSLVEPTGLPPAFNIPAELEGSTTFESEDLIAYELGYRAQINDKISGSISTYYNDYTNIRSTTPGPTSSFDLPIVFQNNLEGHTYGVEVSGDYQMLDWWRLHAGYDFLRENIHVKPGEVDFNNALNETADPQNQFSIRSSMDLPKNVEFDTGLRWVDSLMINSGPTEGKVPSYFELNVRLAWHVTKNLELSIVGQNLLHDEHVEYGYPSPTNVAIERSVYGKIAWHF